MQRSLSRSLSLVLFCFVLFSFGSSLSAWCLPVTGVCFSQHSWADAGSLKSLYFKIFYGAFLMNENLR